MTLAIEPLNRFETYFLNTAADACALCDAVGDPRVGVLLDTFHANIEEKQLGSAFRAAGPRLAHVQRVRTIGNAGNGPRRVGRRVSAALREMRYDGWLTIESFGFTLGDLSAAAAIWRDIAPDVDSLAREGLRFLQRQSQNRADEPVTGSRWRAGAGGSLRKIFPPFITNRTRSVAVMSFSTSPGTATMSASLPGSIVPADLARGRAAPRRLAIVRSARRGRHAVLDEQRELLRVEAVRADAGVGAERDLHAGVERALERGRARRRAAAAALAAISGG